MTPTRRPGRQPRRRQRSRPRHHLRRHLSRALRACVVGALAVAVPLSVPALARGAVGGPQVAVTGADGAAPVLAADAPTTVQVTGTGFQSVPGGFGGIYVLVGWVDEAAGDGWRPSAGGESGVQYRYAVDTQGQENAGYQRFVAFPGSTTSAEANGGEVAADGTWATDLTVPGATLTALGPDGGTVEVDCRQVTCGVLTFGAHGVANANNESFTPVTFGAGGDSGSDSGSGSVATPTAAPSVSSADAAPAAPATPVAAEVPDAGGSPDPAAIWVPTVLAVLLAAGTVVVVGARRRAARARAATGTADASSTTDATDHQL